MSVPQQVLVLFAMWTIMVPLGAIAVFRWRRILTGVQPIHTFRADRVDGPDWYRRAMRAHANCIENLAVLTAVVIGLDATAVASPIPDTASVVLMIARAGQTTVHVAFRETPRSVSVRFGLFFTQLCCIALMGALALDAACAP